MAWASRTWHAAALAALLLLGGLAAHADEPEEWVRPYAGWLPDAYDGGACFLVRDARTGRPLEGVTVSRCPEMEMGPEGWAPVAESWKTDAYGLVHVPLPEDVGDNHWVFRTPHYATTEEYGTFVHDVIDLEPGRSLHGRVVDWRGHPVVDALVEHKIGCAHSPAIHRARTDANGVFVFEDVGDVSDVIVSGQGVLFEYHSLSLRPLDMTPSEVRVKPGAPVTGRIVLSDGKLLAPRALLSLTTMRGPLATLGADGSFNLEGTDGDNVLQLHYWLRGPEPQHQPEVPQIGLADWRPGGPILWRVGQAAEDAEDAQETSAASFVVLGPDGKPLEAVDVHFDRVADGRRFSVRSDTPADGDLAEAELPPGRYEVSAGGPFARWVAEPVPFTHPRAEPVKLTAREQPGLLVQVAPGAVPPATHGDLYLEGAVENFAMDAIRSGEEVLYLPPDAPAWVVVGSAGGVARAVVGPPDNGRRIARLVLPDLHWIEVADIWGNDEVKIDMPDGRLAVVGGVVRFAVGESGRLPLWLVHPEHGSGWAVVDVPAEGDEPAVIDLTAIQWSDGPTKRDLVIVPPAGRRLDEPIVDVGHVPPHGLGSPFDVRSLEGRNEPDGAAHVTSGALRAGVDVLVKPYLEKGAKDERWLNHHVRLEGGGPYRVVLPDCALDLEIVLANEGEDDVTVIVGGQVERWGDVRDGRLLAKLRGLTPGPHIVLVGSPNHESRAARIVVRAGQVRRQRIELPLRKR